MKQVIEGASDRGSRVHKRRLMEVAKIPELKPVKVVRSLLDIVVHAAVLEEELRVAPPRVNGFGARHKPANQTVLASDLRRLIEAEELEEHLVGFQSLTHLVLHVVLVLVFPIEHIVGLHIHLVWPVGILLLVAILVELGHIHN